MLAIRDKIPTLIAIPEIRSQGSILYHPKHTSMTQKEAIKAVKDILSHTFDSHGEGIMVTASSEGVPHATWMGTLGNRSVSNILTMTSPDSTKVKNILENPHVEWMFNDERLHAIVYLRGKARVIHEEGDVLEAWEKLKDKSRAYFLNFIQETGMTFLIIETQIEEIDYTCPKENLFKKIRPPFR